MRAVHQTQTSRLITLSVLALTLVSSTVQAMHYHRMPMFGPPILAPFALTYPHPHMMSVGGGYGSAGSYGLIPISYNVHNHLQQGPRKQIRPLSPHEMDLLRYYDNEDE